MMLILVKTLDITFCTSTRDATSPGLRCPSKSSLLLEMRLSKTKSPSIFASVPEQPPVQISPVPNDFRNKCQQQSSAEDIKITGIDSKNKRNSATGLYTDLAANPLNLLKIDSS